MGRQEDTPNGLEAQIQRLMVQTGGEGRWVRDPELGVPVVAQWLMNPTRNHEVAGSVPALAQWVNNPVLPELWCRLQTRLGSHVAVALAWASGYSSDSTPSLGTSICRRCSPKKNNNNNKG